MKGLFFSRANGRSGSNPGGNKDTTALQKIMSFSPSPPLPHRRMKVGNKKDGLVIVPSDHHVSSGGVMIKWPKNTKKIDIESLATSNATQNEDTKWIIIYGIVGVLKMFHHSYLFVITDRQLCGQFLNSNGNTGREVYKCMGVLAIPLQRDLADQVITKEENRQAKLPSPTEDDADDDEEEEAEEEGDVDDLPQNDSEDDDEAITPSIIRRGSYFSQRTLSGTLRPNELTPRRSATEVPTTDTQTALHAKERPVAPPATLTEPPLTASPPAQEESEQQTWADQEANRVELEEKLIKETARQYARGEMFFAYDFDITTSLQRKSEEIAKSTGNQTRAGAAPFDEPQSNLPLWRRVDRKFFHNEYMSRDFINAGLHTMVLPLMQGFFQTCPLEIQQPTSDNDSEEKDTISAQLAIVSRRSRERPGLRYQRRGINESGQVANYVETEQILYIKRGSETHLFSFVQFRGSIPLFWSQSPFSMKPPPLLERSTAENTQACTKHFKTQTERYGNITCINLAEQSGKEGEITEAYRRVIEEDVSKSVTTGKVKYCAFDFHKECAGMKFENVSKLIDLEKEHLEEMNCFWAAWGLNDGNSEEKADSGKTMSLQRGIYRVSCLDCLDRTNVVESAFGRHMLQGQFTKMGIPPQQHPSFEYKFNDTWANNGDQISQCYAGSRALKGDFTRTGKRNLLGMMNDATASVYRMVQGAITDFWRQTVISFSYGELNLNRLERYCQDLEIADPSNEMRLTRIRNHAIDVCSSMVLEQEDDQQEEKKVGGWTIFSPLEQDTIQSMKLEEKILVLSDKAIYVCVFDFVSEKFVEYTRIALQDIVRVQKGVYFLSTTAVPLHDSSRHRGMDNYGMVIHYASTQGKENFVAFKVIATEFVGSSTTSVTDEPPPSNSGKKSKKFFSPLTTKESSPSSRLTLRPSGGAEEEEEEEVQSTSEEIVTRLISTIVTQCNATAADAVAVEEKPIQTFDEARSHAPLFGGIIDGIKRRLWL
ncbi:unnamed protein product [Sympodiomycopsis kandeliae]